MIRYLCLQRQTAQLTSKQKTKPSQSSWSACHLYGNFGENFPLNGTSIFFGTENRNGIELYHLQDIGKFFAFSRHDVWHNKGDFCLRMHCGCRLFSLGVIFTRARVSFALLSLRKNGGLLVVFTRFHYSRTPVTPTRRGNEKQFEIQLD